MTPPDTNLQTQQRRHRGPLIGMAVVAIFAIGLTLYWLGESMVTPTEDGAETEITPAEIREGDVDVPEGAPTRSVAPEDPEVRVDP
ncbi:hypothetical protein [Pararhodobacter oceanensis]|uniref:hypothetical protein n=1 Tax=Pararhodobacter oceanensis TaxID=2172121 RepID=UPI003A92AC09